MAMDDLAYALIQESQKSRERAAEACVAARNTVAACREQQARVRAVMEASWRDKPVHWSRRVTVRHVQPAKEAGDYRPPA